MKINYLGDWGVQFGLLKYGLQDGNYKKEDIAKEPIKMLHKAYVEANMKAEQSPEVLDQARLIFRDLEFADDDSPEIHEWHLFREYTMQELVRIYGRLGVEFDEYSWESTYSAQKIRPLVDDMKNKGILKEEEDNCLVSCDHSLKIVSSTID